MSSFARALPILSYCEDGSRAAPLKMAEKESANEDLPKCPVCGEELSGPQEDRDTHVNGHLDKSEEEESLALARNLDAGVSPRTDVQNGSTSSDQIGIPAIPRDDMDGLTAEERMIRERELADEAYARSFHGGEEDYGTRLGESVSDSAEHYFEAIVEYIAGLFQTNDIPLLDSGTIRRRTHLCSYMDLFCSNLAGVGWDCGYRNIQMMLSSLLFNEQYATLLSLNGVKEVPSLPEIAGRLEELLKKGNEQSTDADVDGVLTDSKVWIGASEALDLLNALQVNAHVKDFETPTDNERSDMFEWIYRHFEASCGDRNCGLHNSQRRGHGEGTEILEALVAPMYCQWQGHSVTIIGAEKSWAGEVSLIIVDPSRGFYESVTDRRRMLSPQLFRRSVRHAQMQHPRFQIVYVVQVQALVSSDPIPPKARARPPRWKRFLGRGDQPRGSTAQPPRVPLQGAPSHVPPANSQAAPFSKRVKSKLASRRISEPVMNTIAQVQSRPGRRP